MRTLLLGTKHDKCKCLLSQQGEPHGAGLCKYVHSTHEAESAMQSSTPKETRARIMAAFLKLAIDRGIDSTTTRAIAQEAGVSELTLFRHFGDKASLMKEALRETVPSPRLMYDLPVF